jgi:hypothetical protein
MRLGTTSKPALSEAEGCRKLPILIPALAVKESFSPNRPNLQVFPQPV